MKKIELQKLIREELKKTLNEEYRDPEENIDIFYGMLKKGGRDGKYAKDLIKDIKSELNIVIDPKNPKATLALAKKNDELAEYFDDAIESALDDGMGRVRGMYSMSGMREASVKKDDLDKIGDFIMSSPAFERMSSAKLKSAIKDMHAEWKSVASNYKNIEAYFDEIEETGGEEAFMEGKSLKLTEAAVTIPVSIPNSFIKGLKSFLNGHMKDAEQGETYYQIAPGKENELIAAVFSNWIATTMSSMDSYELTDNLDSDLNPYDDKGMAAKLAKKGLLTKKVK